MSKEQIVSGSVSGRSFHQLWSYVFGRSCRAQSDQALHIDVPVKLEKANVVFDIGHLVLNGDMPFFLGDMDLLASDLSNWNVKGEIIAVFHGDAAYLVLNDASYDANRRVQTGHPIQNRESLRKAHRRVDEAGHTDRVMRRHGRS